MVSEPEQSAASARGEWEAERGRGRGIVVGSNGGFPPPVSQTRHVTRPEKERDRGQFRGRSERAGDKVGFDSIDWPVNQSKFGFSSSSLIFLTALLTHQIAVRRAAVQMEMCPNTATCRTLSPNIWPKIPKHLLFPPLRCENLLFCRLHVVIN